ncbi:hypothetical protein [Paenibacillus ginsengihumi]|uniref:hypothetical protein n=1 Tax=Paenibacillus ginsengihumi TaxID=431596 RepID=UPI0003738015|nr:hypothetical protein [Paenibacillus ginsengihumi]
MNIRVYDEIYGEALLTVEEMAAAGGDSFDAADRVPGAAGRAFDVKTWHRNWSAARLAGQDREPVRLQVEAADEFQASIPWGELDKALLLYAQADGSPLVKGHPLRLYVPGGSSECLNVKSVVALRLLYDESVREQEATYGFKNTVSLDELKRKPQSLANIN